MHAAHHYTDPDFGPLEYLGIALFAVGPLTALSILMGWI